MAVDIDKSYFYKLHMLKSASDTLFDQLLRFEVGVGLSYFILLATVRKFQPCSQQEIAKFLDITPGAISRQIETAQQSGWVQVEYDKKDRRKQLVQLTPEGKRIFDAGDACLSKAGRDIFHDRDELHTFVAGLDALKKRIDTVAPKE